MRRRSIALGIVLLLAALASVMSGAVLLRVGPSDVAAELGQRSPGELIRYLQRRLMHHPTLEAVLLPPLGWWQRQVERPVDLDAARLPAFGKGPHGSGTDAGLTPDAVLVVDVASLDQALRSARAGQTLVLSPGTYRIERPLATGAAGTADAPIRVMPLRHGSVRLEVATNTGLRISHPYWQIVGLRWKGVCEAHDNCEHALHVVGAARHTLIADNEFRDFSAHVKINGAQGVMPDDGVIEFNRFTAGAPRRTLRPVSPIDLVAASGWRIRDNLIDSFIKVGGHGVAYGMQIKGGGFDVIVERNLIVCTPSQISQPGLRVGLSFGGGGTGPAYCRDGRCVVEFERGVARNNIVAHCNDAGIDVNDSARIDVLANTLVNTAGIQLRGEIGSLQAIGNLLDGRLRGRGDLQPLGSDNLETDLRELLEDPDALGLAWRTRPAPQAAPPGTVDDFCGRPRGPSSLPGALAGDPC